MPTPSDSVVHNPFVRSPSQGHSSHTTCPPDVRDSRSEYGYHTMDFPGRASPSSAPRQVEDQQPSEAEPSTHAQVTNNNPQPPKMPGAVVYDTDDYLSSSGELSEASSHDAVDTVRPPTEVGPQGEGLPQNTEAIQEEYENLPPPSDIHGLPRVRPIPTNIRSASQSDSSRR